MGYITMFGICINCKRVFTFNPNLVPSVHINGIREPVCRECVDTANPIRIARGLEPFTYHPDAYEPADENSIDWES